MQVLLGNADPVLLEGETRDAPCVTYVNIPSGPEHHGESHHAYVQVQDSGLTAPSSRRTWRRLCSTARA